MTGRPSYGAPARGLEQRSSSRGQETSSRERSPRPNSAPAPSRSARCDLGLVTCLGAQASLRPADVRPANQMQIGACCTHAAWQLPACGPATPMCRFDPTEYVRQRKEREERSRTPPRSGPSSRASSVAGGAHRASGWGRGKKAGVGGQHVERRALPAHAASSIARQCVASHRAVCSAAADSGMEQACIALHDLCHATGSRAPSVDRSRGASPATSRPGSSERYRPFGGAPPAANGQRLPSIERRGASHDPYPNPPRSRGSECCESCVCGPN